MLMWKCDVCSETGESPTSLGQFRLMPKGWRVRTGLVPNGHEVEVHVCSDKCAKRYDAAEAEQIGYVWRQPDDETLAGDSKRPIRPLKVK